MAFRAPGRSSACALLTRLARSHRKTGVSDPKLEAATCKHCGQVYEEQIQNMELRIRSEADINAVGGVAVFSWL